MSLSQGAIVPRDMNQRQWAEYARAQQALPRRDVQQFTPTWSGFSSPLPHGDMSAIDMGSFVLMFWTGGVGQSNSASLSFSGVPEALRPELNRETAPFWAIDNTNNMVLATAIVQNDGVVLIMPLKATSTNIGSAGFAWTTSGDKGIFVGASWMYPK